VRQLISNLGENSSSFYQDFRAPSVSKITHRDVYLCGSQISQFSSLRYSARTDVIRNNSREAPRGASFLVGD
jgi:hypothetical protein